MPFPNKVIIASAGSRKTTSLIEEALKVKPEKQVLITTYTNENVKILQKCIVEKNGYIPENVKIETLFKFYLQDGVRPYQKSLTNLGIIQTINFISQPSFFTKKSNTRQYYFDSSGNIYSDKVSEFICSVNEKTNGEVIKRLEKNYDYIFIDEVQDLCGYDLEFLKLTFTAHISVIAVGDPRQATFHTNKSAKNKGYKGKGIYDFFDELSKKNVCEVAENNISYRCNQAICDFADSIYPELNKTTSKNDQTTEHDGIFQIHRADVEDYVAKHQPMVLRYDKRANTEGLVAMNIGISKGNTFDRVLIFPTGPMKNFIQNKNPDKAGDRNKFYVAVTRAKYSVAFVIN
jgi:DNA helicase-2/ATP-dependent DNA helicase PcrA